MLASVTGSLLIAKPMAILIKLDMWRYIDLRKLQAKYSCARDGDHFCVGDDKGSPVDCNYVGSTFVRTSLLLRLFYQTAEREP